MLISDFFRPVARVAAAALLLLPVAASAQNAGKPRLGLKTGLVLSRLTGDDVDQLGGTDYRTRTDGRRPDFFVSLASTIPLTSSGVFTIAPELSFSRKGYRITNTFIGTTGLESGETQRVLLTKRKLNYLELPLAFRVNTNGGLYFELGPQVSYLMGSESTTETTSTFADGRDQATSETSASITSDVQDFDFGAIGGIGFQHRSGFTAGLRYSRGFKTVLEREALPGKPITNNDAIIVQFGYLLQLGK
ncbi:PorT family protein [Hymenobacter sp. J193]|uniref:porin family protein n=1 Tax=Hymenobacter sp. J193 TaxID=2898429 RepID=UPI002150C885|nr:porin family protein [Hymenobacter sp. J193]MCR5887649.1 PorT family protein [Hymenobacter sp. J193]